MVLVLVAIVVVKELVSGCGDSGTVNSCDSRGSSVGRDGGSSGESGGSRGIIGGSVSGGGGNGDS